MDITNVGRGDPDTPPPYLITITPFTRGHIESVVNIERESFADPWSVAIFENLFQNPLAVYFTALDGAQVVGYAGMYVIFDEGQIQNIAVTAEYRRHGVGSKLLSHMLDYGTTRDISVYTLEVRVSNLSAIALYKKFGFIQTGVRKNYYRRPVEDALLLERNMTYEN